jgi:hypothetical protein
MKVDGPARLANQGGGRICLTVLVAEIANAGSEVSLIVHEL